jgi:hypothetical protein
MSRSLVRRTALITSGLVAAGLFVALPVAATAAPPSGAYHAITPTRLLDTRTAHQPLVARATRALTVTGRAGVPATAAAVVVTVTVTAPSGGGYLTAYPSGESRPATSTLNFTTGRTVPNLAVVRVGTNGQISIYNGSNGHSDVLVDVSGYYTGSATPAGQGAFGTLPKPVRMLDTRSGIGVSAGAVGARATRTFTVTRNGVPATASAVVLNVGVTAAATSGWLTAYPYGGARPGTSNLNFGSGATIANLVVVPVGSGGKVTVYNGSSGSVQVFADVSGYFLAGDPVAGGALGPLIPARVLDTRSGLGVRKGVVAPRASIVVPLKGRAGIPLASVTAVVLNVTATQGSRSGYLTVYGGGTRPAVSNVNYAAGQTVPDLVVAPVSSSGTVTIYNGSSGSVHVLADVSGYVLGTDLTVPNVSISRYVRTIGADFADATSSGAGCADAHAGSTFVLLDIGAQLNDRSGVALTVVDTRVTYPNLVTAVDAYLQSFAGCTSGGPATVALGTNNGGDFSTYTAAQRGTDWADKVVDAVTAPAGVSVVGANDIEGAFSSTEAQAEQWETNYLAAATTKQLVFNGSADGCPATYGAVNRACAFGWTQANYYTLAGGHDSRIKALPQVYLAEQAVQWANIDATGGKNLSFAGVLTERAACSTSTSPGCDFAALPPTQGWAALYHALSTVVATPDLPAVTDLLIDS